MDGVKHTPWWEAGSVLRAHVNSQISGDPEIDWLEYTINTFYKDRFPISNCLSLGCGSGEVERRLAQLGAFRDCDGYESPGEIEIQTAIRETEANEYEHIHYHIVDFDRLDLPTSTYELVYTRDLFQHLEALEHVLHQIRHALTPNGLLILNGYIGPTRFQFPQKQQEYANLCLQLIPDRLRLMDATILPSVQKAKPGNQLSWLLRRLIDKSREGDLLSTIKRRGQAARSKTSGQALVKRSVNFPTPRDVMAYDSTLALRSGEILKLLEQEFVIVERKDWGGNIFQFLLSDIAHHFSEDDPQAQAILKMLTVIEETLISMGSLTSDFAYVVARPRQS